jgi:hypothetical protein
MISRQKVLGFVGTILIAAPMLAFAATSSVPTITSFSPASGLTGTVVTVKGTGFTPTNNTVYYWSTTGYASGIASSDGKTLTFTVPSGIFGPVTLWIRVGNTNGMSNAMTLKVTAPVPAAVPTITALTPTSGPKGTVVTVTGTGFTATNNTVRLGDLVTIPGIASSDGKTLSFTMTLPWPFKPSVKVSNAGGTSNAKTFTVTK